MSFRDEMREYAATVETDSYALFANICSATHASIQVGSAITGAPGQPVDTGALRASWELDLAGDSALISTGLLYAPDIEDGMRTARSGNVTGQTQQRLTLRSPVGGFHSVALTIAGFSALVDDEVAKSGGSTRASGRATGDLAA